VILHIICIITIIEDRIQSNDMDYRCVCLYLTLFSGDSQPISISCKLYMLIYIAVSKGGLLVGYRPVGLVLLVDGDDRICLQSSVRGVVLLKYTVCVLFWVSIQLHDSN